ncbi:Uncharacterized protein TCAP_06747 [Tolypocladium capitatum]|uniref:Uncharacterized protein n=1 Tax=Tolypocladium capitatum TaxID=45235 RepID=A0A2K3Q713_9HYPO|nr:Uncharacterized protein TCAP_06747 [Tolypocladium capitatum]
MRCSPAAARMRAVISGSSSSFPSRVWMLPRTSLNLSPGYRRASCAMRRTLLVPMTLPAGRSDRLFQPFLSASSFLMINVSRGSSLLVTQPRTQPSGSVVGMSLSECTTRSSWLPTSSSSSCDVHRPLPPKLYSAVFWSRSPVVVIPWTGNEQVGKTALRAETTISVCARASGDFRVPTVMVVAPCSASVACASAIVVSWAPSSDAAR